MKTTAEKIAVMQASLDGAEIQVNRSSTPDIWGNTSYLAWDWSTCDYRIKPQPQRLWVNEHKSGRAICHTSESIARDCAGPEHSRVAVEYVEVTDKIRKLLEAEQ